MIAHLMMIPPMMQLVLNWTQVRQTLATTVPTCCYVKIEPLTLIHLTTTVWSIMIGVTMLTVKCTDDNNSFVDTGDADITGSIKDDEDTPLSEDTEECERRCCHHDEWTLPVH
jgi:hypothetical protein